MRYNKVEYSTDAWLYYTMHDFKVNFCIPEFSRSKIIQHRFHVKNDKGESGIGYDMIILCDLMIQLGLSSDFKCQVLQWGGVTVPVKEPIVLIGKSYLTSHDILKVVHNRGY